ncbi:cupin domain-containing protein [Variovorax sp. H27-G14]|uniref:cupin domain-containing protein n=1 Tax=Variovorax sp. H27-G14 TaxID=3111914 RepID=UPI0038FBF9EC
MDTRRIVTGHNAAGKSVFVSDTTTPRNHKFTHVPGFETALVWGTEPGAAVPGVAGDPAAQAASWVPERGGTRFLVVTFPPDSATGSPDFDPAAAGNEYMQAVPGLAERFEMESPGMHTTDTVDYAMLLAGEIHLELDDGLSTRLAVNDIVVQQGTRHAWRNHSTAPATMLFVLIGAERSA